MFKVTLPLIELNIVLSLLPNTANAVPGYLTMDWAKYSSQSTSRSGEFSS